MKYHIIKPQNLTAEVTLPASKSLSNRALLLSALSGGGMKMLTNVSDCDDTTALLRGLGLPSTIDVGAAGTSMRFLTALLAIGEGSHIITGSQRMCHRPIGVLVEALRQLGADISYVGQEGFPPLNIKGHQLRGGEVTLKGDVSSQYISALMMIGPRLEQGLRLHLSGTVISRPYIQMTMEMMQSFGAEVCWEGEDTICIEPVPYAPIPYLIEADWSAASYWYEIVLLSDNPQETATLTGLFNQSLQGDRAVGELFDRLSVRSIFLSEGSDRPKTSLIRRGAIPASLEADFTRTPDLAQTLVVSCALKGIPFRFCGLQSLRIKETDRIAALQKELRKLGVQVEVEGDNIMQWDGPEKQQAGEVAYLKPAPSTAIDTYEDHRMAMAFAPAALVLGSIDINNPEVVSKSYPRYWEDLKQAGFEIQEL
ncbi:MAG: 3-phosphoshikimate 1-carboxyvinyltransferase [Bacteroidaceae bacterium]|nr:3-phosphoshikimate 1-carboxyvinyltransferase [Bacteroidaceae bacterium]